MKKNEWVVTRHPDDSPAIYRRSRVISEEITDKCYKEIRYNNGRTFIVRLDEKFN